MGLPLRAIEPGDTKAERSQSGYMIPPSWELLSRENSQCLHKPLCFNNSKAEGTQNGYITLRPTYSHVYQWQGVPEGCQCYIALQGASPLQALYYTCQKR